MFDSHCEVSSYLQVRPHGVKELPGWPGAAEILKGGEGHECARSKTARRSDRVPPETLV